MKHEVLFWNGSNSEWSFFQGQSEVGELENAPERILHIVFYPSGYIYWFAGKYIGSMTSSS